MRTSQNFLFKITELEKKILAESPNQDLFEKRLAEIRRAKYKVLDLNTDRIYEIDDKKVKTLKNFILIRKSHIPKTFSAPAGKYIPTIFDNGEIKIFVSDLTTKLKPNRECSSDICKEILSNINKGW